MTRPTVADLWCSAAGCCTPNAVTLSGVPDDVKTWFIAGGIPGDGGTGDPGLANRDEYDLLVRYAAAIEIAYQQISNVVCMAKFVGHCTLTATICVEETECECREYSCSGNNCGRTGVSLRELACYIAPERIAAVTIDGESFEIDTDPAVEDGWMLTTHDGWLLTGPTVKTGGTFTIELTAEPSRVEWTQAILSRACALVPGTHEDSCSKGTPEFAPPPGFLNDPIADSLDRRCQRSPVRFGSTGSNVRSVKWKGTTFVPPGAVGEVNETQTPVDLVAGISLDLTFATMNVVTDVTVRDSTGKEINVGVSTIPEGNVVTLTSILSLNGLSVTASGTG